MFPKSIFNRISRLLLFILLGSLQASAQPIPEIIQSIQELMLERYIYLDKAEAVNVHLDQLWTDGFFEAYPSPEELAGALTREMRKITQDNHLAIIAPQTAVPESSGKPDPLRGLTRYTPSMVNGFQYFEQNVGYFDMRYFGGGPANLGQLDDAMQKLSKADALIIDLRYSLGGSPATVQYLCSYFFDEAMLLSSIYSRYDDHTQEYHTVEVNGRKRPEVPIFILTSDRSFSAAEDFPYTMQAHGRATIVGEVTRGGAHPTRSHYLPGGFRARIPFARSIHPRTQSNWEGVGVIPDVEIPEDQALEKAKALAKAAAEGYRDALFAPLFKALGEEVEVKSPEGKPGMLKHFRMLVDRQILGERDINRLGYNYFQGGEKQTAAMVFQCNTLLHPQSANAFDSYAEALADLGRTEQALENYKKAVALAKAQNHPNVEAFEQNLAAFEQK